MLMDDVLRRDSGPPLCAAELGSELQKQFAVLPGGRSLDGSPIVFFPEFPAFGELEEEELQKVLRYLTSIPKDAAARAGFVLVIDRRLDRWAAVRTNLLRIAGSFPAKVNLVLVLHPTSLLQRTLSYFFFEESDFKMKVVMLSSVTELQTYIDPEQLSTQLGGTQEYCHHTWISQRTAIEAFAFTVKTTAETLHTFGTELAATELPIIAEATTILLHTLILKKDKVKEDLQVVLSQGGRLLDCITDPLLTETSILTQGELENLDTVQSLLSQLDESETAFDAFWERHRAKLERCLQRHHFERHFGEVRVQLDLTSHWLSSLPEVGVSPAHSEHILQQLGILEHKACGVLVRALSLASEGETLIGNSHYAEDAIRPKCSELRAACEEISSTLRSKKDLLLSAQQLQQTPEKVEVEVESPVHNGSASPAVLSEGEKLAVFRRNVMNELLATERTYVRDLLCVLEGYAAEMDNPAMAHLIPSTLLSKKDVLFGNLSEICQFHQRTFLKELEAYRDCPELVGRCFLERMKDLQLYEAYCQNNPRAHSLWMQFSDCAFFQVLCAIYTKRGWWMKVNPGIAIKGFVLGKVKECQKKLGHLHGLGCYLIKPVQRITKYQLLLKELLNSTQGCDGHDDLQEALSSMLEILQAINDSMHLMDMTGYQGSVSELGRVLIHGAFNVSMTPKTFLAKVRDLTRVRPVQRHLFLQEKVLLVCKRTEGSEKGSEKGPSYRFKHSIDMSDAIINGSVSGDDRKFEVWCSSRQQGFVFQAPTPEIKDSWVKKIEQVLSKQLDTC